MRFLPARAEVGVAASLDLYARYALKSGPEFEKCCMLKAGSIKALRQKFPILEVE